MVILNFLFDDEQIRFTNFHFELERGNIMTKGWRNVKKVGTLLEDAEDIGYKQLVTVSMTNLKKT